LTEVGDDELTCSPKKTQPTQSAHSGESISTFPPSAPKPSSRILTRSTTQEPDIIWSVPITQSAKIKTKLPQIKQPLSNDDTLIIGIVGGVVAFIAILIIIICIVRLRMSGPSYPNAHLMQMPMGPGSVQLSYKTAPTLYAVPPYAAQSYATLPHKMSSSSQPSLRQQNFSTMGRMPANGQQQQQPYYIYQDDKAYR
jgi:hypothetical protein